MSTRSQVLVEGGSAIVYRHSDGYPDGPHGVLKVLLPLVGTFMKYRGMDQEYLTAHICAAFIKYHQAQSKRMKKRHLADGRLEKDWHHEMEWIGNGVEAWDGSFHGDVAFIYLVKVDHGEVRQPSKDFWDEPVMEKTKVFKRFNFDGTTHRCKRQKSKPAPVQPTPRPPRQIVNLEEIAL